MTALFVATSWAATLVERFDNPFPDWESRWLGTDSNLTNYYVEHGNCHGVDCRGNNPDGLWISDGIQGSMSTFITFDPAFAETLTWFEIDIASHAGGRLVVMDDDGATLLDTVITSTSGATVYPGIYSHYSIASTNGIGGFNILSSGSQIEGNVGIDNVLVRTDSDPTGIPEPSTIGLLGVGLGVMTALRRRS
jgi:hypothetical protein